MRAPIVLCSLFAFTSASPIVEGSLGKISGKSKTILGVDIEAFLGIPYAKAPVGNRRFSLPEPYGYVGNLQAVKYPPACPQPYVPIFGTYSEDENCLFLNVFRKRGTKKDDKKAVVAIIHGGANLVGSSADAYQSAEPLAGVGDVILVSFNYRLGMFGFSDMKDLAPGNLGLRDQRMVLEWIQDHISDFGGDPNRVSVMGVSSGSASTAAQILTIVDKKDLFNAALLDAGVTGDQTTVESSESSFMRVKKVAKAVGCPIEAATILECLRNVSVGTLLKNSWPLTGSNGIDHFIPTTDGDFLPLDFEDYFAKNSAGLRKVRMIIGHSRDEGSLPALANRILSFKLFMTRDEIMASLAKVAYSFNFPIDFNKNEIRELIGKRYIDDNSGSSFRAISNFVSDGFFKCPINAFIRSYSRNNDKVFAYRFERESTGFFHFLSSRILGVYHGTAFIYFVGSVLMGDTHEADRKYSLNLMKMISEFSKSDGALKFRGLDWPSYSTSGEVFVFNDTPSVTNELASEQNCRKVFPSFSNTYHVKQSSR